MKAGGQYILRTVVLILIGLVLLFEVIRDCSRNGDFIGYINAGNLVLSHKEIYSDILNTWPPFFSVICVPLSILNNLSPMFVRLLWLSGSLLAMYFVIRLTIQMLVNMPLILNRKGSGVKLQDSIILIPALIMLRFLLENLANLQINIFMLLMACLTIYYFINNKYLIAGFLLAFSISLKVYTVFLLLYFIYKREWKIVATTFISLLLINAIPFFVFGYTGTIHEYTYWYNEIVANHPTAIHLNQSIFGLTARLLTNADPENNFYINFLSLKHPYDNYITYCIIILIALYPAFLFRKKLNDKSDLKAMLEYSLVFSIIPVLSAVAWKAYFIFLWLPYLITYVLLFRTTYTLEKRKQKLLKGLFFLSILFNVFTSDGIIGKRLSDILQSLSCITIGTTILIIIQIILYRNVEKFDLKSISLFTSKDKTPPISSSGIS